MRIRSEAKLRLGVVWIACVSAGLPVRALAQVVAAPEAVSIGAEVAVPPAAQAPPQAAAAAPAATTELAAPAPEPAPNAPVPLATPAPQPAAPPNALPPAPPPTKRPPAGNDSGFDWSAPRPPVHREHNFYLRLNLGLVAQHASYAREPDAGGGALAVAAGGAIARELVLFGELNVEGNNAVRGGGAGMLGVGVAYVLQAPGVYFSAAVGPSRGSYRIDDATATSVDVNSDHRPMRMSRDTAVGVGVSAAVGKEWLIDEGPFGLGLAAFGRYSNLGSANYRALGLALSGTYF